ncbi:periplasmic solute binding protein [Actinobaculum suis]|uniref:Periplasmic solute binding protein n=1 Tax=Actinobaculum suis TaxID=1657 RepID=A0A1B9BBN3_9ACTO|nr:zinc ABC transporter substrate-binding protein [Actinobaculum suis]OCA93673.1 hypothetical protein ACU20_08475 [Actinobaculum suis]OCA94200.1 hypothetical protein ACU21_08700 [Actinobaculum suis]VDG76323.1 periplasmic solute binding protein [Actinobaculum suis]
MKRRLIALASALTLTFGLAACGNNSSSNSSAAPAASNSASTAAGEAGKPGVVASTNVWGAVAQAVAGEYAEVTSIITKPTQDPHDYEATAQDKLAFSDASVVLVNGGGYDEWATKLAASAKSAPTVIDAVALSGLQDAAGDENSEGASEGDADTHEHAEGEAENHGENDADPHAATDGEHAGHHHHADFNEHVFFSLETAGKVADELAKQLGAADPVHAEAYTANAKDFKADTEKLRARAAEVGKEHPNTAVLATEPVVGYLLADMGIANLTPDEYIEQSETDAGPSTKVIAETKELLTSKKVAALLVNGQTTDAVSDQLVKTAEEMGIPAVGVYETFPEGISTYEQFVGDAITAISAALR